MRLTWRTFRFRWLVRALACAGALLAFRVDAANLEAPRKTSHLSDLVRRADDYYAGRWKSENVRKGLALLREETQKNPGDYEAWWRIAMFANYLSRHSDGPEEQSLLEQAMDAGRRAVALEPGGPEGHFWLGASEGLYAEDAGLLKGLRLVIQIRQEMETVQKLDPDYQRCGAERTLARVDYRVPFFKGGDKQRSVALLQDCLRRCPNDSLTMLYLAESLLAVGRRDDARGELEKILNLCPDPLYGPELEDNQREAREDMANAFGEKRAARHDK